MNQVINLVSAQGRADTLIDNTISFSPTILYTNDTEDWATPLICPKQEKKLTKTRKYVRKRLKIKPEFIIFNKSNMAKHPDIELNTTSVFKSIIQLVDVLKTDADCREHLEKLRWNGEPICPKCGSQRQNHYRLSTNGTFKGLYKCKDCRERFTVTVGTMFEGSHISLRKWFLAIYMFSSHIPIHSHSLSLTLKIYLYKTSLLNFGYKQNFVTDFRKFQFSLIFSLLILKLFLCLQS